jgi:hypothetical protein
MNQYKNLSKQFKKEKYKEYLNKSKAKFNKINPYPKFKYNRLTKTNKAPDVSTITEHIAFVIDGQVVEIIHCQSKMAAILLSEPLIVQIPEGQVIKPGWRYEEGKFVLPEQKQQEQVEDDLPTFKDFLNRLSSGLPQLPKMSTFKEYISKLKERV